VERDRVSNRQPLSLAVVGEAVSMTQPPYARLNGKASMCPLPTSMGATWPSASPTLV